MMPRTSTAGLLAGLVLCCSLATSPVRGGDPTIEVTPAVRQVAEFDDGDATVTTVGWRRFGLHARHAYRRSYYRGWGPGIRSYGFYRPYPSSFYYGGYSPYYYSYSAPVYRTTYYAPTYYAPTYVTPRYYAPYYYAPSYTIGYAPPVYSYRPVYYAPVLYGGYGYYYPGCY